MRLIPEWACHVLPMCPKVPVGSDNAGQHLHDDLLPFFRPNRPWPQFRIFVVLVVEHEHWNHPSALFLISKKLGPSRATHIHTAHEPARPVAALAHAIVTL